MTHSDRNVKGWRPFPAGSAEAGGGLTWQRHALDFIGLAGVSLQSPPAHGLRLSQVEKREPVADGRLLGFNGRPFAAGTQKQNALSDMGSRKTPDVPPGLHPPLHRQLNHSVELPEQRSGPLAHLDVVAVCEAGGGGRRAQLCLSAGLGLLQGEQLGGRGADQQGFGSG